MRFLILVPVYFFFIYLNGQNENFPPLDDQLILITQPLLSLDAEKSVRIHLGTEKFLTKFPNAPRWNSVGIQLPSRKNNTTLNFYFRQATEGIFRKLIPGIGYDYSFTPDKEKHHRIDLGLGVDFIINSIDRRKVNTEESDPYLYSNDLFETSTVRPLMSVGYTYFSRYGGGKFKADLVVRRGLGFSNNISLLGRLQADFPINKFLKLKPVLLQSSTMQGDLLLQVLLDLEFQDFFSIGVTYLSDTRYGFSLDLPIDLIYREDHLVCLSLNVIFRPKYLASIGGTSYGLSINYQIWKK